MIDLKALRALCDAAPSMQELLDAQNKEHILAQSAVTELEMCQHSAAKVHLAFMTEKSKEFYEEAYNKIPALIDEIEKYEKALRFILENSEETLANNVAFKALGENNG